MRIAHITSFLSRSGAGVRSVVECLSRAQVEAGNDVKVFGMQDHAWNMGDNLLWEGGPVEALPVVGPKTFGYMPDLLPRLYEFDADVVHLHGLWVYPNPAAVMWSRSMRRPFICTVHGMLSPASLSFSPLKKKLARFLFQARVLKAAAKIHVTSDEEAKNVRRYGIDTSLIQTKLGIDIPEIVASYEASESQKMLLTLGRLHPIKGLEHLLNAWAIIAKDYPSWRLKIIGPDEGGYKAKLDAIVENKQLPRVTFDDPIFGEAKFQLMQQANLFVLPTLYENFALTVAESLAVGTPVVVSKGAPWSEVEARGCGWWVNVGPVPLAEALRNGMDLPQDERHAMGLRGKAWMEEEFSWPAIADQMDCEYQSVIEQFPKK